MLTDVLQELRALPGGPSPKTEVEKDYIPHHPIVVLRESAGLTLPTPLCGFGSCEQDYLDILPPALRDSTTVIKLNSKRVQGGIEFGFLRQSEAQAAESWMLLQNAIHGTERFKLFRGRDPGRGGLNVFTDCRRIGLVHVRALTMMEAADEARGWITQALACGHQHTIMEPYMPGDAVIPRTARAAGLRTTFIVYISFRTTSLARMAAQALDGIALIGPEFAAKYGVTECKAVEVNSNWESPTCEKCSKRRSETGSCPCGQYVVSIELDEHPIHERVLRALAVKLSATKRTFGSSWRAALRGPQRWATLRTSIDPAVARAVLDSYKEMGHISEYYSGVSMGDPAVIRCNACGLRNASCTGKGPGHLQPHVAGDKLRCPYHVESPTELKELEGWPRRTGRRREPAKKYKQSSGTRKVPDNRRQSYTSAGSGSPACGTRRAAMSTRHVNSQEAAARLFSNAQRHSSPITSNKFQPLQTDEPDTEMEPLEEEVEMKEEEMNTPMQEVETITEDFAALSLDPKEDPTYLQHPSVPATSNRSQPLQTSTVSDEGTNGGELDPEEDVEMEEEVETVAKLLRALVLDPTEDADLTDLSDDDCFAESFEAFKLAPGDDSDVTDMLANMTLHSPASCNSENGTTSDEGHSETPKVRQGQPLSRLVLPAASEPQDWITTSPKAGESSASALRTERAPPTLAGGQLPSHLLTAPRGQVAPVAHGAAADSLDSGNASLGADTEHPMNSPCSSSVPGIRPVEDTPAIPAVTMARTPTSNNISVALEIQPAISAVTMTQAPTPTNVSGALEIRHLVTPARHF